MNSPLRYYVIYCCLFLSLAFGGAGLAAHFSAAPVTLHFSLTNEQGRPVTEKNFQGQSLLIFFGFTGCSNICPLTLSRLKETQEALKEERLPVKVLFITLDPQHDNPATLAHYLAPFHADIEGLTGQMADLKPLYKAFKVYPGRGGASDHSGLVYLVDGSGTVRARFTTQLTLADTVRLITNGLDKGRKGTT